MNFGFKEEMGFEHQQIKQMLLTKPKLWLMSMSISFISCKYFKKFKISIIFRQTNAVGQV
jgi:hypothetical protein